MTPMSTSWEPLPSIYPRKQEFLASLPPWSENARLSELDAKLSAILSSSATSSTPTNTMPGESET